MSIKGLYFITDCKLSKQGIVADTKQVLEAGCRIIQYREKEKKIGEMAEEAKLLKKICKEANALFLVNDRVGLALAVDADGVHLGQGDMPLATARKLLGKKVIGLSVKTIEQALQAEREGADYLGVGPIFHTGTKKDAGKPLGLKLLKQIKEKVSLPIVAIGGINSGNFKQVLEAGADSVAIISAIACSENVLETSKKIVEGAEAIK